MLNAEAELLREKPSYLFNMKSSSGAVSILVKDKAIYKRELQQLMVQLKR